MNALTTTAPLGYAEIERLGAAIAKSGLFGIRTPEQAVALMMIASAEGRHPALAARDYDIIQNRPAKKSEAMLRDFLEAGGKVEWHALSDDKADATFSHSAGGKVRITWDMARANKAGLGGKDNWKKFPRQMLRSRCVSEGVRTVWPMATSGLYVPEEVSDFVGPTINHEPEPAPAPDLRSAINKDVPLTDSWAQQKMALIDKHKHLSPSWTGAVCKAFIDATTSDEVEALADEVRQRLQRSTTPETNHHIGAAVQAARKRIAAQPKPPIPAEERLPFPGDELVDGVPEPSEEEAPEIVGEANVMAG